MEPAAIQSATIQPNSSAVTHPALSVVADHIARRIATKMLHAVLSDSIAKAREARRLVWLVRRL